MNLNYCVECAAPLVRSTATEYVCENKHPYYNNPRATVCIVFIRDGHVLLSKRAIEPNKGKYDLPGGFVEYNEDVFSAAIREVKEESGVDVTRNNLELVTVFTGEYLPNVSVTDIIILAKSWDGTFLATDDSEALEWKPFNFTDSDEFSPAYSKFNFSELLAELADKFKQ